MNNSHIIIGYGNWAKKIIKFLKRNNFFSRIIVITRKKQFFILPKYKKIDRKDLNNIFLKAKSVHICSNNQSHFLYIKKFVNLNKDIIVEKPFINSQKELQNINKIIKRNNKKILVNYTDLYNSFFPKIKKIFYNNLNNKIYLNVIYSKQDKKFKKKYQCVNEWLDHPLSIILELFKSFPKFKIIGFKSVYRNKIINEELEVQYKLKNILISFLITNMNKKKRIFIIKTLKKNYFFDLNDRLIKNNKSSFYNLYKNLNKINKSKNLFNLSFHKKIFKEKLKIIKKLK